MAGRPGLYSLVMVLAVVLAGFWSLRRTGIFACQAGGYGADRYLSYCQATSYGDYDHGAFWFDLEPRITAAATSADVLFLGNSRMQLGLSTRATAAWFASVPANYYLLGFSHNGNFNFEGPLLGRLHPRARVYVINLDLFFDPVQTGPAATVIGDRGARTRYEQKRLQQGAHKLICSVIPLACRDEHAFFRSRPTGAWVVRGGTLRPLAVSYDSAVNQEVVKAYTTAAAGFLSQLPVDSRCVILTMVPTTQKTPHTPAATARAIADQLGLFLVDPQPDSLMTFDQSHLDSASAERFSSAFLQGAGSRLSECLAQPRAPAP